MVVGYEHEKQLPMMMSGTVQLPPIPPFSAVQMGQHFGRDKRTIRKAIKNINYNRKPHCNKGTSKRSLEITDVLRKHPLLTSKVIFSKAGVPNISKATQNRVLKQMGSVK